MTGQHLIWSECNADWCTHCLTSDYFFNLNGTLVTVIDHHPQLTGTESYYTASQCEGNSHYDLFTVSTNASLTFENCELADVRVNFHLFAFVAGSIAFIDTRILRLDFYEAFIWAESDTSVATVLFDHSYVTGWHRDNPLLNIAIQDSRFLYLEFDVNLLIRNSVFEENYELVGTFLTYSEFMYFNGINVEVTDSVFRYCNGAFNLSGYQPYSTILLRNVTIDSHFNNFLSSFNLSWRNFVTFSDVHFLNCLGNSSILSIQTPVLVFTNVEFTNNRLLPLASNAVIEFQYVNTVVMSNCTFTNNGGYTDSYAPYFFYSHLLSLGLINSYPEIAQFYADASIASCAYLIYASNASNVTVSDVRVSGDLESPCTSVIYLDTLQGANWTLASSFHSLQISGGSTLGIGEEALNQVSTSLTNCVFQNLDEAISLQNVGLSAYNSTFSSIGKVHFAGNSPVNISAGHLHLLWCSFLNGLGVVSGAVYLYVSDKLTSYNLSIINCVFDGNTAVSGGATDVLLGAIAQSLPAAVELRDCTFRNAIGEYPSSALWINTMTLGFAVIVNCTFTSIHDMHICLLKLEPGAGTVSITNVLFDSINAPDNDLISLQPASSATYFLIENLTVLHSVFSSCINIGRVRLNTTSCHFESNTGIVLYNSAIYFQDNWSYFYNNSNVHSPGCHQSAYAASAFYGTLFINNSAAQVGVIEIIGPNSYALFQDCQFRNNSATVLTGVMRLTSSPDVHINNCIFLSNSARFGSVFLFERALLEVFIENTVFGNNTGSGMMKAVYSTVRMLNVTFTDLDFSQKDYQIILLSSSKLTLKHSTVTSLPKFQGKGNCLLSILMGSTANISNTVISSIQCLTDIIIVMFSSSLNLIESTFTNVSSKSASLINSSTQSQLLLQSTRFSNISVAQGVLYTQHTDVSLLDSSFYSVKGALVLHTESCSSVIIQNTTIDGVNAHTGVGAVQSIGCSEILILDSNFTDINATMTAGVQVYGGNVTIEGCLFQDMNGQIHGAIEIEGGRITVSQSNFLNNSAGNASDSFGGGLYINTPSNTSIVNNTFLQNTATAGGAVYWNSKQSMFELKGFNAYEGNIAIYGADIASSAFKLSYGNGSIPTLASGQVYTGFIMIKIVDLLEQVIATDNSSEIMLRSGLSLEGNLVATAVQGIYNLSGFIVTGVPGTSANITIVPNINNCLNMSLSFPLRDCVIGEIEVSNGACVRCSTGTYSLNINGTACSSCFPDATCINGSEIYPNPGYWRPDTLYDGLFQCPNIDACENTPILTNTTGVCASGYTGNMCQSCVSGYSRSGKDKCAACPSYTNSIIALSFLGLAIIIFLGLIIRSSLQSASNHKFTGIFLKILLNYLHITVLIANFDLNWPVVLQKMFNIHAFIGSSGVQFISFACEFSQAYFKKLVIISILPVSLMLVNLVIWTLFHMTGRVRHTKYKFICSLIVSWLYVHPTIVQTTLSTFHCITIKAGEHWLRDEMDIPCWDYTHSTYTLGAGLPALILWAFGIPAFFLFMLIKDRKQLTILVLQEAMGFLSFGYQEKFFFWEMVIVYRKVAIILLYVFLSTLPSFLQALALCILLCIAESLHTKYQPYKTAELNKLEERSLWVCIITIYSGIFFSTQALSTGVEFAFSVVIILANAHFLALWMFYFCRKFLIKMVKKHPGIRRFLPCLRVPEIETVPKLLATLPYLKMRLYLTKLYSAVEQRNEE